MQATKTQSVYKYHQYQIFLTIFSSQKIELLVLDTLSRKEYHEKFIELKTINNVTLVKALEAKTPEISLQIIPKKDQIQSINIICTVQLPYINTIREQFGLRKLRQIDNQEFWSKSLQILNKKLKELNTADNLAANKCQHAVNLEQKTFSSQQFQPIVQVKLTKGKYLLTFSSIIKCNNQWAYIYLNNTGGILHQNGFYVSQPNTYYPINLRCTYFVPGDEQKITINTYCANSYPITCKNTILTASKLQE